MAGAASLALVVAACGSSGGGSNTSTGSGGGGSGSGASSTGSGSEIVNINGGGTPKMGGTLTMLGTGDVDYMDPNISYYAIGYLGLRMWSRSLYTYPAVQGKTFDTVPDLATAAPKISADGKTYSITLRKGAMWDTSPARQVTADDVVLGIKRTCNPTEPFGGSPDFSSLIAGYTTFCDGFSKVSATDANAQKQYMDANQISGVTADPSDPLTVNITLTKPTSYFADMLALPCFSPAPVEYEQYLPASNDLAQHTISDGPYKVSSYSAGKTLDFVRNPDWQASTDPIRKAYVNAININETGNQDSVEQQILTNTPQADMEFDSFVPPSDIPGLIASKSPALNLQTEESSNPFWTFNTASPNSGGALNKTAVRQAISYAIDRTAMIQNGGGPKAEPPLTHVLPPGLNGSKNFDDYPYNVSKAKSMLAAAGYPGGKGLSIKILYRNSIQGSTKDFQTLQAELSAIGVKATGVGVPNADFYTKYLEQPSTAKSGVWDMALDGWSSDWYGDAAASYFSPLFDGRILPPTSSNFGLFNDPQVNALIDKGLAATSSSQAGPIWEQADQLVMKDAAIYPITDANGAVIAGSQVHNRIYMGEYEQIDPTNVWLSNG